MAINSQSKLTLQQMLDKVLPLGDLKPILADVAAYQLEPFVTICSEVYSDIVGVPFPHEWNRVNLPVFYTNSLQQDYALLNPDGSSVYNVEWVEKGICILESSNAIPKPWGYIEAGRDQSQMQATYLQPVNWTFPTFITTRIYNNVAYFGTWGDGNTGSPSLGNNPGPGSVYTDPLASLNGQQLNPITQVKDFNGNLQVVTTYGTCGLTQPNWPGPNAAPGTRTTDGTTTWTVVDPYGVGIRISPVPSQSGAVFQFRLQGQLPAIQFSDLSQTFSPFPDKYQHYFRKGIIARCYEYSSDPKVRAKFPDAYKLWLTSLTDLRVVQDREPEENRFIVERTVFSSGSPARTGFVGPSYPFNYPRR